MPTFILEDLLPITDAQKVALSQDIEVKALAMECEELNVVSIFNTVIIVHDGCIMQIFLSHRIFNLHEVEGAYLKANKVNATCIVLLSKAAL